jgi:hypothetical protein
MRSRIRRSWSSCRRIKRRRMRFGLLRGIWWARGAWDLWGWVLGSRWWRGLSGRRGWFEARIWKDGDDLHGQSMTEIQYASMIWYLIEQYSSPRVITLTNSGSVPLFFDILLDTCKVRSPRSLRIRQATLLVPASVLPSPGIPPSLSISQRSQRITGKEYSIQAKKVAGNFATGIFAGIDPGAFSYSEGSHCRIESLSVRFSWMPTHNRERVARVCGTMQKSKGGV